jgi:hypothetical protein
VKQNHSISDTQTIESILKNKAFKLFNKWVTNAKKNFPILNYQIKELKDLEDDLLAVVFNAVDSLLKEEKIQKRKKEGYDYGFICGFVQGSLNVKWYNEYIYKQSK